MLNEIVSKVYQAISFVKGDTPNLDLLSANFIDEGIFINNKGKLPLIKSVADYVSMIRKNIENGNILSITEIELTSDIQVFGKVAQISSEYELIFEGKQGIETRYGVNLFQLIHIDDRWLISSMCWDDKPDKSLLTRSK